MTQRMSRPTFVWSPNNPLALVAVAANLKQLEEIVVETTMEATKSTCLYPYFGVFTFGKAGTKLILTKKCPAILAVLELNSSELEAFSKTEPSKKCILRARLNCDNRIVTGETTAEWAEKFCRFPR